MSSETKNYELAYLLSPSVSEGEVLTWSGKITKLIQEAGCMLRRAEEPRKRRLAYPVKKEVNAYFGYTTFASAPGLIPPLVKKIKSVENLLRQMIVEEEIMEFRPTILRTIPSRPTPARRVAPQTLREPEKVDEKLDLEALDKRLEEILGK